MTTAGVYLHIPFCRSRCSYCDFATDVYKNSEAVDRYVNALVSELNLFPESKIQDPKSKIPVDTIYFGGGTPSLLTPTQLEKILEAAGKNFTISDGAEITMEMNPATVTLETLAAYKHLGVNRASFGAQTFDDRELKRLGRRHTASDVRETIELLRGAGYRKVGFDLIAGLPRQTLADWERNLDEALELKPEHLSLYLLEIHEATPLAEQIRSGRQPAPDEELAAAMYEMMLEKVGASGLREYEISNFAKSGYESKHNQAYWNRTAYKAFGLGACSFDGQNRFQNEKNLSKYINALENNKDCVSFSENLTQEQIWVEKIMLGLRQLMGLELKYILEDIDNIKKENLLNKIDSLIKQDLLKIENGVVSLTRRGLSLENEIVLKLIS